MSASEDRIHTTASDPTTPTPENLAVVVLAGGRSLRMGQDKRELLVDGRSLVERCLHLVCSLPYPVLLANRTGCPENRAEYHKYTFQYCPDDRDGRGPAAGLLGAANSRPNCALLAIASDLPFISRPLLRALVVRATERNSDVVVPKTPDGLHPLVTYYSAAALEQLRKQVGEGRFGLQSLLHGAGEELKVDRVTANDLGLSNPDFLRQLFNCNTPNDWQRAQQLLQEHHNQDL